MDKNLTHQLNDNGHLDPVYVFGSCLEAAEARRLDPFFVRDLKKIHGFFKQERKQEHLSRFFSYLNASRKKGYDSYDAVNRALANLYIIFPGAESRAVKPYYVIPSDLLEKLEEIPSELRAVSLDIGTRFFDLFCCDRHGYRLKA